MRLWHIAALAMVGWYLLFPPSIAETSWICATRKLLGYGGCPWFNRIGDPTAPLSAWHYAGSFARISDCEQARQKQIDLEDQENQREDLERQFHQEMMASRCIANDDPRLR